MALVLRPRCHLQLRRAPDGTVTRVHEKYGPAHLIYHKPIGRKRGEEGYFRIELPLKAVPSLSVVPALLSRTWGFGERLSDSGSLTNTSIIRTGARSSRKISDFWAKRTS